jgi:hypothetical protein
MEEAKNEPLISDIPPEDTRSPQESDPVHADPQLQEETHELEAPKQEGESMPQSPPQEVVESPPQEAVTSPP